MKVLEVAYESEENATVQELMDMRSEDVVELTTQQFQSISRIWRDKGVQKCYQRRREYQLSDSTK